jgi:hypothetical protein
MTRALRFGELIEMIDQLPLEAREQLVEVARKRIADERRKRLARSVRSARREQARRRTKATTADELMREIRA